LKKSESPVAEELSAVEETTLDVCLDLTAAAVFPADDALTEEEEEANVHLTQSQVELFESWIKGELVISIPLEKDLDTLILATTHPCPVCSARATRYQGHDCHHVKEGCQNLECQAWYCVKCKSTEAINIAAGRTKHHCACIPIIFCSKFESNEDVQKFLVMNAHGYPIDSRCGCPICPDCAAGKGCDYCDGKCAVCKNVMNPGPRDLTVKWIAQSAEQIALLDSIQPWVPGPGPKDIPVSTGPVGTLIKMIRDRLDDIHLSEDPQMITAMADINTILTFLNSHNDDSDSATSAGDVIAMLDTRLKTQEQQLATMFAADTINEAAIQQLMDKIERTNAEISRGGSKSSGVPALSTFTSRVTPFIGKGVARAAIPTKEELVEYEKYCRFIEGGGGSSSGSRARGMPFQSSSSRTPWDGPCGKDCSESHSNDGDCLVCNTSWGSHAGHSCPQTSANPSRSQRGSWEMDGEEKAKV